MGKPIKYLLFTTETVPAYAGDGRNAFLFAKELNRQGFESAIVCLNPNKKLSSYEIIEGIPITRVSYWYKSLFGRYFLRVHLVCALILGFKKYTHWTIYGAMPAHRIIILLGKFTGKKVIFRSTLYGFDNIEKLLGASRLKFLRLLKRRLYGFVSGYFALNSCFGKEWRNWYRNIPVFQSLQGVDMGKFNLHQKKEDLRIALGLPMDRVIILMIGHLINRKGFPLVFEWLSHIDADFILLHVGRNNAPEWDALSIKNNEMLTNKAKGENFLGNKLIFVGNSDNTEKYIGASDIFLLASESEGFPPNAVNEAMAGGLPVFLRNIPGVSDFIVDGKNGFIFSDEIEFRQKLLTLIQNPFLRIEIGERAKQFAFENAQISNVAGNFIQFTKTLN